MARLLIDVTPGGPEDTLPVAFGKVNTMTDELYPAMRVPNFVTFGAGGVPDRLSYTSATQFLNDTHSLRAVLKVRFSEASPLNTNQVLLSISNGGTNNAAQLLRLFFVNATRKLQLQIAAGTAGTAGSYTYNSTAETYTLLLSYNGGRLYAAERAALSVYDSTGAHIETIYGPTGAAETIALSTAREIAIGSLTPSHTATTTSYFQGDMGECRLWVEAACQRIQIRGPVLYTGGKVLGVDVAGQSVVRGITGADFVNRKQYNINGQMYRVAAKTATEITLETPLATDFSGSVIALYDSFISKRSGANEPIGSTSITDAHFNAANAIGATFVWGGTTHTITGYTGTTLNFTPALTTAFAAAVSSAQMIGGSARVAPPDLIGSKYMTGLEYDRSVLTIGDSLIHGGNTYTVTGFGDSWIAVAPALIADVAVDDSFTWISTQERGVTEALKSPPDLAGSLEGCRPLIYYGGMQTAAEWNSGLNQGTLSGQTAVWLNGVG